ncbi:MAG: hypothetical protein LQ347_006827 [Umbilicaria vellea]|nr:MAG: hypothetical protein LQ347_006827 [Umbilicaria vellea]
MLSAQSSPRLHVAQNVSLILLSLFFLPFSTFILFLSYALQILTPQGALRQRIRRSPNFRPTTILVTGVGMAKGLTIARAFYEAGHDVIGADFEPYGIPVCGRFSRVLSRFYALSKPTPKDGSAYYIQGLLQVVRREKVDLWVSCSGVASAVEDGEAKEVLERRTDCKAIQYDVHTTALLHEKHSFIQHTMRLGLPAPETYDVSSRTAVHKVLNTHQATQYIMKSVGVDDASRGDMTLFPRPTISETYERLAHVDISDSNPWVLQQFIRGDEYCTHALVIAGHVRAFVACPSSELLMHYEALPSDSALSKAMLKFTEEFAARSGEGMTGHLSFDFLVDEKTTEKGLERVLYPIECNPRAHTAVVLFKGQSVDMAQAYLSALPPKSNGALTNGVLDRPVVRPQHPAKYYWVGHDLVEFVLLPVLESLRGKMSVKDVIASCYLFVQHVLFWKDGTYEVWDPLPWFCLYHVYWPGMFLASVFYGRRWSRVNVSTTKMFEC